MTRRFQTLRPRRPFVRMAACSLVAGLAVLCDLLPALAQRAPNVGETNQSALRGAREASLVGALHEFAWERGAIYAIQTAPQRITDLALETGETLLSVSAGDTTRWIVGDAKSGSGAQTQVHVLVKPNAPGLATNLVIMTDRRIYHVDLKSSAGAAMAAVAWRYPADMRVSAYPEAASPVATSVSPSRLNLRYRIEGARTDWRPLAAFDDGRQAFIEMPEAIATLDAPPLFVIGEDGAELVNYRVEGRFYVVDRLFQRAELRLGTGRKQRRVAILRETPIGVHAATDTGARRD
jgi:type IV secretion system protein TrbG